MVNRRQENRAFSSYIGPKDVQELINFGAGGGDRSDYLSRLQSEGVAALYNILCEKNYAYLADEVGMGKTYQALGLAALLWNLKPESRIIFVAQRENLQENWVREYRNLVARNYRDGRHGDDRVKSLLASEPVVRPERPENLREFASALFLPGRQAYFLRMSSFRRPVNIARHGDPEEEWSKAKELFRLCGFYRAALAAAPSDSERLSLTINLRFCRALNDLIADRGEPGSPSIDMLVIDEAQSLRNVDNQTNQLLREIFSGNVSKWLFLSATPNHAGGWANARDAVNYYANPPERHRIRDEDFDPPERLARQHFLVRRRREGIPGCEGDLWHKYRYRQDRVDEWAVRDITAIEALAVALVQKRLVPVLKGGNNRFRVGLLTSFESLEESLLRKGAAGLSDDGSVRDDIFDRQDPETGKARKEEAPDADFVSRLSKEYARRFDTDGTGARLPHPKLERIAERISGIAFREGRKVLVFMRRINAVEQLRLRVERLHEKWIEERVRSVWGRELDWEANGAVEESDGDELDRAEPPLDEHPSRNLFLQEAERKLEAEQHSSRLRKAFAKSTTGKASDDGWLLRYRRQFERHRPRGMFFQENWLQTLHRVSGVPVAEIRANITEDAWQRSYRACGEMIGSRIRHDEARRTQFLLGQLLRSRDWPNIDREAWLEYLHELDPTLFQTFEPDRRSRPDDAFVADCRFWEHWQRVFAGRPYLDLDRLIAVSADVGTRDKKVREMLARETVKNWIAQSLLLTDALVDLYHANSAQNFFDAFLAAESPSIQVYSRPLLDRLECWVRERELIRLNCFDDDFSQLARRRRFSEMYFARPVVGITGGDPSRLALRQFKMPYDPQVLVCTDVLKEGENLHTFCDMVVHYGLAWTAGDMEQRIGRLDRFFSRIERRLPDDHAARLDSCYPHLPATIEQAQVIRVLERMRRAALELGDVHDSIIEVYPEEESCEIPSPPDGGTLPANPFDVRRELFLPGARVAQAEESSLQRRYADYEDLATRIERTCLANEAWTLTGLPKHFGQSFGLSFGAGASIKFRWEIVSELGARSEDGTLSTCYALRAAQQVSSEVTSLEPFSRCYEVGEADAGRCVSYKLLFPAPIDLERDGERFRSFCDFLIDPQLKAADEHDLDRALQGSLRRMGLDQDGWKFRGEVERGVRRQAVAVYVYDKACRIASPVGSVTRIRHPHLSGPDELWRELRAWIERENGRLHFGFLHLRQSEEKRTPELSFGEMLFHHGLDPLWVKRATQYVGSRADMYEAYLTGADKE